MKLYITPSRTCYTIPVSTTGSLWTGYGAWHYRACSFLGIERYDHLSKSTKSTCRFIEPMADFVVPALLTVHRQPAYDFFGSYREAIA